MDSVPVNKILATDFAAVQASQNLIRCKICQKSEIKNLVGTCFKSNRMFGTKHSKTNRLQKTIEYQTNEQITKYSN